MGTGRRTEDQGIIEQTCQQEPGHLRWNSYTCFMIESCDNCACAANGIGPEHDWLVGMDVRNAVMVDDAQQFGLFDAINGLRLFIVIHQYYTFRSSIKQVCA